MATSLSGIIAMQAALTTAQQGMSAKIDAALYTEAEAIMTISKPLAPVKSGVMRASGYVAQPTTSGNVHRVEMGYGGAAAAYVIYVHERLDLHHAAPTQAKFLEQPLREAAATLIPNIATRIAFDKS